MRKRDVVVMMLGCIAFVSGAAHADVCPSPGQAVSCHNIEPTAELASLDNDVEVPLGQVHAVHLARGSGALSRLPT